ncbi:MAG: Rieske 2Fe-2S domain-containing protein [Rhodoluna sp.]
MDFRRRVKGVKRRELIGGSLALATVLLTGLAAQAKDISLGKASQLKVGAAKVFTIAGSRILVFRSTTSKYTGLIASCPHDATSLLASHVKAAKVSCPKDKSVFSASTGKKFGGPTAKSMTVVPIKTSNGFLIATLAVAAIPTATATPTPTPTPSNSASGEELIKSARVPVAGGVKVGSRLGQILVVQPTAGVFAAFSVICNHAGCAVSQVTASAIICPCHGSEFSTANGAVSKGPATQALMQYDIFERDGAIFLR